MSLEPPYKFSKSDPRIDEEMRKDFGEYYMDRIVVQPGNVKLPAHFQSISNELYNIEIRPDDVWVCGIIKSGTTWLQELVYCIHHEADLSPENKDNVYSRLHSPETEMMKIEWKKDREAAVKAGNELGAMGEMMMENNLLDDYKYGESPRTMKIHLPISYYPPSILDVSKVIYIARNPKDTCVSAYHHFISSKIFLDNPVPFEKFAKWYFQDEFFYMPYWYHLNEAWKRRHHKNLLILKYEEMKQDIYGTIHKIAHFLEKKMTPAQVQQLVDHVSFRNMASNPNTNMEVIKQAGIFKKSASFQRKGIVGDWKNHFTVALNETVDRWIAKNKGTCGIEFPGFAFSKL